MKKAFTFEQIALILLALIILIALIMLVILQKDQIASAMQSVFGGGQKAVQGLENVVEGITT